jgi:DnaJ-class molecular chaperone
VAKGTASIHPKVGAMLFSSSSLCTTIPNGEKQVTYKRGKQTKKLMVKIPSGAKPGTKIRLKDMGIIEGKNSDPFFVRRG